MRYVIWMVALTVIAVLLFTAKRNLPEIRDYRQSKILYLASFLKPGGYLILALMALSTFFASVHQVPAGHSVEIGSKAERQDPGHDAAFRPELHLRLGSLTRHSKGKEIGLQVTHGTNPNP